MENVKKKLLWVHQKKDGLQPKHGGHSATVGNRWACPGIILWHQSFFFMITSCPSFMDIFGCGCQRLPKGITIIRPLFPSFSLFVSGQKYNGGLEITNSVRSGGRARPSSTRRHRESAPCVTMPSAAATPILQWLWLDDQSSKLIIWGRLKQPMLWDVPWGYPKIRLPFTKNLKSCFPSSFFLLFLTVPFLGCNTSVFHLLSIHYSWLFPFSVVKLSFLLHLFLTVHNSIHSSSFLVFVYFGWVMEVSCVWLLNAIEWMLTLMRFSSIALCIIQSYIFL